MELKVTPIEIEVDKCIVRIHSMELKGTGRCDALTNSITSLRIHSMELKGMGVAILGGLKHGAYESIQWN